MALELAPEEQEILERWATRLKTLVDLCGVSALGELVNAHVFFERVADEFDTEFCDDMTAVLDGIIARAQHHDVTAEANPTVRCFCFRGNQLRMTVEGDHAWSTLYGCPEEPETVRPATCHCANGETRTGLVQHWHVPHRATLACPPEPMT